MGIHETTGVAMHKPTIILWAFLILSYLALLGWGWSMRPVAKAEWSHIHGTYIPPESPGTKP